MLGVEQLMIAHRHQLTVDATLQATPSQITFNPAGGQTSRTITVANQNGAVIRWSAAASAPWIQLSKSSGFTGEELTLTFNDTGLGNGTHNAAVTLSSPDVPGQALNLAVSVQIGAGSAGEPTLFLPNLKRED